MALSGALDKIVGPVVATLPDGTEYRQVLTLPQPQQPYTTPDGRSWVAVREGVIDGNVVVTPFTIHWKGRVALPDGQWDQNSLAAELVLRLVGPPADGSRPVAPNSSLKMIWVDAGDEVLVHLDTIAVRITAQNVLVSVDLETDQTGRTPLIVSFALNIGKDVAGLVAVTDDLPSGNGLLAARWGRILQNAIWASLLGLGQDFGALQNRVPRALTITNGVLKIQTGPPLQVQPNITGAPR